MSHVGVFPTGENPSAGPSQRKPPAARIDESAVVPGIPIASRAHHFLVYQTRIERHSPVGADDRSRTGDLRVGTALFCLLNYIRNMTVLAIDARVASPAGPHARQRTPQSRRASAHWPPAPLQPSRIVRDRSSARSLPGWARHNCAGSCSLPEAPRLARCLDDVLQFLAHVCFLLRTLKSTRPGVLSEHPGLVLAVVGWSYLSISIQDASGCLHIPIVLLVAKRRADRTGGGRRAEHGRQGAQGHG